MILLRVSLCLVMCACTKIAVAQAQDWNTQDWNTQDRNPRDGPLIVRPDSHVVVMEYEAWFGPNAMNLSPGLPMPLLQSADMASYGGGYDSRDPAVIRKHVEWLEQLGMDAVILDLTNDVSCTFNSEWFVQKYLENTPGNCPVNRPYFQGIRDNTGNIYPAWQKLGTRLKIIPQVGGIDQDVLYPDLDGKTAFEKEIEYFGALMRKYPGREVIEDGKPLMLVFVGASQDPVREDNPLWLQIRNFLKAHPQIGERYTFRSIAGYLDSQPDLWTAKDQASVPDGPVEIDPNYGFWSWVDRLNPTCTISLCPYYPSYNRSGDRVENFTVSLATAGQDGWGCPNPNTLPYCEDDALRWDSHRHYATFHAFMDYAWQLDPVFLIVHQFNEFVAPDEGFNADTNDDIEPGQGWGYTALEDVQEEICRYREAREKSEGTPSGNTFQDAAPDRSGALSPAPICVRRGPRFPLASLP